jgi:UDP-glucuronate decarboxylase
MAKVIFDKKNVLVAGGAGFIGSHLCDELVKECKVICVDNFISGSPNNIDHLMSNPNFVLINHDLSDVLDLETIPELKKYKIPFQGIQEIYNLACPMSARHFLDNRLANLMSNSYATKNLLDLAVKYNSKFLQFSSSVVYGPRISVNQLRVREDFLGQVDMLSERSSYDEGKRFSETLVENYRQIFNLDTKIIRIFRTYGPRMSLDDDQMIPDFIANAIDGKELTILGDESFSSSFCYVSDVIDAVSKVIASPLNKPVNIGADEDVKVSVLAQIIIEETKSTSTIKFGDKVLFMSELPLPDIYVARNELAWMPVVTLRNGLKKTIFDLQAKRQMRGFSVNNVF